MISIGTGLIVGSAVFDGHLSAAIDERVRSGVGVDATVIDTMTIPTGKVGRTQRLHVTYAFEEKAYQVLLLGSAWSDVRYSPGDRFRVFVDRQDPSRVASADGFASEGYLLLAPIVCSGTGIALLCLLLLAWFSRLRYYSKWRGSGSDSVRPLTMESIIDSPHRQAGWSVAIAEMDARAASMSRHLGSQFRLRVVFQIPGDVISPAVCGAWLGPYWRRHRLLTIFVGLCESRDSPEAEARKLLGEAISVAEQFARRTHRVDNIAELRAWANGI